MGFWGWAGAVDWGALAIDVLIPVAAILIPTVIAIRLARSERKNAIKDRREERRLEAGAGVIVAVAPLASMHADHPMQTYLWELRARIAVYRASIPVGDPSGDWLAFRHREGMHLWRDAFGTIDAIGGSAAITDDGMLELLQPAHKWAGTTTEMFTAYLSGHLDADALLRDGARILQEYPHESDGVEPGSSAETAV